VIALRAPVRDWDTIPSPPFKGKFFSRETASSPKCKEADGIVDGRFTLFFHQSFQLSFPPDWFANPFERRTYENLNRGHWSKISDFGQGDIKCIWELSRFAWVYPLIQAYWASGEERYCDAFWRLVEDWAEKNPPNKGVHWKCGQEVAIRMMALVAGYFAFQNAKQNTQERRQLAQRLVYAFAKRIDANIGYALSQNNNHGITEAAGLFTAGVLFGNNRWTHRGRILLEREVQKLVTKTAPFPSIQPITTG
jgi:hypothetical protein